MPHLYKFRSGLIINLERLSAVMLIEDAVSVEDTFAVIVIDSENVPITRAEYDELVEKCERFI